MNNKGFTLIELLAVIVILVSISFVAVSQITSSLARRDVKECEEQIQIAKNAAKIYFSLNNVTEITISDLRTNGYFNENEKIDKLLDNDKVIIDNFKYKFTGNGDCHE